MQNKKYILITFMLLIVTVAYAQRTFITPVDTFHQKRFTMAAVFSGVTYSAFSYGLYQAWYKQYDQSSFQLFNDWNEWNNMDKMGHFYTAYFQGVLCYKGARWTGLNQKKSILTGVVMGTLFQTTIEVMDGFSEKWGFSLPDITYNTLGVGTFALEQWFWDEQRITFKVSSYAKNYNQDLILSTSGQETTTFENRANELFGSSFAERFLKDYNAQTLWASINIHSFLPDDHPFPKWLNLGLGTGSENMFGGFENKWSDDFDNEFELDEELFPRYRQFFIGIDVDLTKMPIDNYYWKSLLSILNIFKIPGPAIEINTLGQVKFHIIHF